MTHRDLESDLGLALELADIADAITTRWFRRGDLKVDTKADASPVTEADREVEHALRARLQAARPADAVLGEEEGGAAEGNNRWILDPIDGTSRFARGIPLHATLVALEREGKLDVGVVSAPALGLRWHAARGRGAFRNSQRIHVSSRTTLADCALGHGRIEGWIRRGRTEQIERLVDAVGSTFGYGDFWIHMLVAEGSLDLALEPDAVIWDIAALAVIVEEAGGALTNFEGRSNLTSGNAIASNGLVHEQALQLVNT